MIELAFMGHLVCLISAAVADPRRDRLLCFHGDYKSVHGLSDMDSKRPFAEHLIRQLFRHDDQIITAHADLVGLGRQTCHFE